MLRNVYIKLDKIIFVIMENQIQDCVIEGRFDELVKLLSIWNERISGIRDPVKNTLVHHACLNEQIEILDHILKYVSSR
jgi:hypothetical protein